MPKNNFVTELVNAFNLRNYYFDDVNTNFTVKGNKIVGLFASDVEVKKYFQEVRKEIIKRHYGTEEVAGEYYNLNYFPFVFDVNSKWKAEGSAIREVELADSTNNEVIRNLKIYFAKEFQRAVEAEVVKNLETSARMMKKKACECLEGSVLEEIDRHSPYLYCISFNDRYCKENRYPPRFFEVFRGMYISAFDLKLEEYGFNDSSIFYEQRDNKLYIKDITNINVVKNVAKHVKGRVALDFRTPGKEDSKVENFKDVLSSLMPKRVRESISAYDYDIFTDKKKIQNGDSFVLIPLIEMDDGQFETLSSRDASKINRVFNNSISDIKGKTANPKYVNCKEPVYAFSNQQIALLLPKIMESPIAYNEISGSFEFAVDLENFKRRSSSRFSSTATSPTHTNSAGSSQPQSPSNSPIHAGPSGLKTPPNQRERNSDSGYDSNSPPKPKDSGSSSSGPGPSTKLSDMEWEPSGSISGLPNGPLDGVQLAQWRSPTGKSQGGALKESPRQGLEEPSMSHRETREELPQRTYISSATIKLVVSDPSSSLQSVGAAQNVRAGTSAWSQPIGFWSPPAPSAEPSLWQPSRPSSWKGANESGSAWTSQPIGFWSSPAPSAEPSLWQPSRSSSWKGANERGTSYKPLTKEEKSLFKALLYAFNLNNYIWECPHTNFIIENGKIASLIDDSVDVKEYLKELRNSTIEEYYRTEEKAKEACDLNEFPFKFLSNCEKNQETTVTLVANISRGALLNLKKLFIQEYEKEVEIEDIDINIIKKAVKSKKNEWVDSQVKKGMARPCEASTTCYPDESKLEHIPIIKDKGGYWLDRDYSTEEVKSFLKERRCAKGTRNATTTFEKIEENKKDDSSSGYSSGFVTDAENISSKAEATTSGYESMDCENTREGSPKRTLELSMGMEELAISTELDATKTEQLCSPIKKPRSN